MLSPNETNVSLWVDQRSGKPCMVWDESQDRGELRKRTPIPNEKPVENPFVDFVNADNANELLCALSCLDKYLLLPDIVPRSNGILVNPKGYENEVASLYRTSPTKTDLRRASDTISSWSVDSLGGGASFIPLDECVRAAKDLRTVCTLFAYSVGECSYGNAKVAMSEPPSWDDGSTREFCMISDKYPLLRSHHEKLHNSTFFTPLMPVACKQPDMWICSDGLMHPAIIGELRDFGRLAFSLYMSDTTRRFVRTGQGYERDSLGLDLTVDSDFGLGIVWSYFAEQFFKGRVSICDYCGNVFVRQRNTKRTCSNSCKQMLVEHPEKRRDYATIAL